MYNLRASALTKLLLAHTSVGVEETSASRIETDRFRQPEEPAATESISISLPILHYLIQPRSFRILSSFPNIFAISSGGGGGGIELHATPVYLYDRRIRANSKTQVPKLAK